MEDSVINDIIDKMQIEEKVQILTGETFWTTYPIERLNIPSIFLADGPHGIRKVAELEGIVKKGIESTCYPTSPGLASSWNTDLVKKLGETLGEECISLDVQILLGPGVNLKRSPLCGRNFEYYSEDPILTGEIGVAFVNGVQSKGIGTTLKHFALNNQEYERFVSDSIVNERTMRELYLMGFEIIVKKAQPTTIMTSYNKINGINASENSFLLRDILKKEWGFKGFVVSDWMASNNKENSIKNGLDLEMPTKNQFHDEEVINAIKNGKLDEKIIDEAVFRVLTAIFKTYENRKDIGEYDRETHHQLAREFANESIVLLKNENNILPLEIEKLKKIAIIGDFALNPRYQGAGSSEITPSKLDIPFECLKNRVDNKGELLYAQGYNSDTINEDLIQEAVNISKNVDVAIIFAGLPPSYETEGRDRKHMDLPLSHNHLIEEICKVQKNTIVVLSNGSSVTMPWISYPSAVIEAWLAGQAFGSSIVDILTGKINPSGKLSESFPIKLEDNPSFINFGNRDVIYGEGLFIGYRYYEKKKIKPLFPFGFGLSYTTFEYTDLEVNKETITNKMELELFVTIKNIGSRKGKEIIQVYVRDIKSTIIRPIKELKAFKKIELDVGEAKKVKFMLNERDFAYWDSKYKTWVVESGEFEILVGSSSEDIKLKKIINMTSEQKLKISFSRYSLLKEILTHPNGRKLLKEMVKDISNAQLDKNFIDTLDDMDMGLLDLPLNKIIDYLFLGNIPYEKVDLLISQLNADI